MKKNIIILIIIVLLIAITIVSYFIFFKQKESKSAQIALNVWPGYAHAFIALEKGFFKENGVDVELILTQDYLEAQNLFTDNKTNAIFEVFTDTILNNIKGYSPSEVVYISETSTSGDVIIAKPEISSVADLKGKTIGVDGINTFSHFFVLTVLEKAGLLEKDVFFKNISANNVLSALENNEIDAGHTWEPTKTQALNKNYKTIAQASDVPNIITDVLVFDNQFTKENPQTVQAIVKSMFQAQDFVENNKEEAIKIMAQAENMTEEEMTQGINGIKRLNLEDNLRAMTDNDQKDSLFTIGQKIINFYQDRGQTGHKPDLNLIINPQFIKNLL